MLISEKARFFEFFHAEKAIPPQGMPVPPQAPEIFGSHAPKNKKVRPKKSGGRRSPNRRGGYYPPVIAIFRNHTVGAAISRLRLSVFDGKPLPDRPAPNYAVGEAFRLPFLGRETRPLQYNEEKWFKTVGADMIRLYIFQNLRRLIAAPTRFSPYLTPVRRQARVACLSYFLKTHKRKSRKSAAGCPRPRRYGTQSASTAACLRERRGQSRRYRRCRRQAPARSRWR